MWLSFHPRGGVTKHGVLHCAYAALIAILSLVRLDQSPFWGKFPLGTCRAWLTSVCQELQPYLSLRSRLFL